MLLAAKLKKWNRRDSNQNYLSFNRQSSPLRKLFCLAFHPSLFRSPKLAVYRKTKFRIQREAPSSRIERSAKNSWQKRPHPVVRGVDYPFNWINNLYLANTAQRFVDTYPLDSDLYIALSSFQTTDLSLLPLPKTRESTKTTSSPPSLSLKIK